MFFKKFRYELRELNYSMQKLIDKYVKLEKRITVLEREKAATKPRRKVCVGIDINNTNALKALDEIQEKAKETLKTLDKLTKK